MESPLRQIQGKDFGTPISFNNISYTREHKSSTSKVNNKERTSKKHKVHCSLILEYS